MQRSDPDQRSDQTTPINPINIGTHVNLAARLQTNCEPGKILISDETFRLVERDIRAAPRGEIRVKGIAHPIRVHEVEGTGEEKPSPC